MRKQVFKVLIKLLMAILLLTGCSTDNSTSPALNSSNSELSKTDKKEFGKVLIVYYSLTGNTRKVANTIKDMTGGDIFEIQPEEQYYRSDIEEIAKKQVKEGYKPKLINSVSNIESYDLIFVGSPVWWFSVSPPVVSFLSQYDLKDKKVVPFCTYGSAYGDFFEQFKKECPGVKVLNGRDFTSSQLKDMEKVKENIEIWLKEIFV